MTMVATSRFLAIALNTLLMGSAGLAAAQAQSALSCSVTVDYVLTAQDGTVIDTESYQNMFVLQPGADFEDDFSTPTRFKLFTASMQQGPNRAVVTISYFNDVSTFNSVDFDSQMSLLNGQATESLSGAQTFSTSTAPLSGHYTTTYALTCQR